MDLPKLISRKTRIAEKPLISTLSVKGLHQPPLLRGCQLQVYRESADALKLSKMPLNSNFYVKLQLPIRYYRKEVLAAKLVILISSINIQLKLLLQKVLQCAKIPMHKIHWAEWFELNSHLC